VAAVAEWPRARELGLAPGVFPPGAFNAITDVAGVSPLFQAALEATEEAVDNSLLRATPVASLGRTVEAIRIGKLTEILKRYGVLQ
jgi:L-aminopeptidase/D-esterase-like protein